MGKRRSDGEGSIYQDSDGRWRGAVVVGYVPAPGTKRGIRAVRKIVSGRSRREVADKLRQLRAQVDGGEQPVGPRSETVHDWLDYWLEDVARPSIREHTYDGYEVAVRRWKRYLKPRLRLQELTVEHLEGMYSWMRTGGDEGFLHSEKNIRLHHAVMHRALTVARKRRRVRENVAELVELPELEQYEGTAMPHEQAWAFLDVAFERPNPARWLFALLMGWRQGEVLGLTWDRIDLDAGTVRRGQALARVKGKGLQIVRIKTKAGEVTLQMPPVLVGLLRVQRDAQLADRAALGPAWVGACLPVFKSPPRPVDLVFPRLHGQAMSREDDWAEWHKILKLAGIPPLRLHDARHTMGTFLAECGVHPKVAQHLLGHAHDSTTTRIYTHIPDQAAAEALRKVSDLLTRRRQKEAAGETGSNAGSNMRRAGAGRSGDGVTGTAG